MSSAPPPTFRYFITGRTGSGKTSRMVRDVLSRVPRLILVDQTGEWFGRPAPNKGERVEAPSLPEVVPALRRLARHRRWCLVTTLDPEELEELRQVLMPAGKLRDGPAVMMGGLTIALDEVDQVIGPGTSPLRHLWRRGRHAGISIAAASQRIGNVSKEVTSQSDLIAVMAVHDAGDQDYLRSLAGRERADRAIAWANLAPFNVAYYAPQGGDVTLVNGEAAAGT